MNEALNRHETVFPFPGEIVRQTLKEFSEGTADFLMIEEAILIRNTGLYDYLMKRKEIAGSFLDRELYKRGAFFTHRVFRLQSEKKWIELPQIPISFSTDNNRGLSETRLLSYYNRQKIRLMEEMDLANALEAIAGSSLQLPFIAGAIDVYFPLKNAIENG